MTEFKRRERDYRIELKVLDRDFVVNVSPTSHPLLKRISTLQGEAKTMLLALDAMDMGQTVATVEMILAKEKEIIDQIIPGEWEGFYAQLDGDVLDLTELVGFVVNSVLGGASRAKVEALAPVEAHGEEV